MKLWLMALATVIGGCSHAAEHEARRIDAYLLEYADVPAATRFAAQMQAARMFAGIGLKVGWHCRPPSRPSVGPVILITLAAGAPDEQRPGTLAYALPYEGIHIRLFYNRIANLVPASGRSVLLAHVLVHEITHILQGVSRHSEEGVMKATWSTADYQEMLWKPLPFTREDVDLIVRGLDAYAAGKRAGLSLARDAGPVRF